MQALSSTRLQNMLQVRHATLGDAIQAGLLIFEGQELSAAASRMAAVPVTDHRDGSASAPGSAKRLTALRAWKWRREWDYSGRPALRPAGQRRYAPLFKIVPDDFVEPARLSFVGSNPPLSMNESGMAKLPH
ncbi:MAG: hypothetical protein KGI95_27145 [Pseudomonas sp.]|nr:hypothetical protein [Pseudomonas sp.]